MACSGAATTACEDLCLPVADVEERDALHGDVHHQVTKVIPSFRPAIEV